MGNSHLYLGLTAAKREVIKCKTEYVRRLRGQRICDVKGDECFEEELVASSSQSGENLVKSEIEGRSYSILFASYMLLII